MPAGEGARAPSWRSPGSVISWGYDLNDVAVTTYETKKILKQQREFAAQLQKVGFAPILEQQRELAAQLQKVGFAPILEQQRELAAQLQKVGFTPILEQQRKLAAQLQKVGFAPIVEQQRELAAQLQKVGFAPILEQQRELAAQLQKVGFGRILRSIALDLPRLVDVDEPVPADSTWSDVPGGESAEQVLLQVSMWFARLTPAQRRAVRNGLVRLVLAGAYLIYTVGSDSSEGEIVFASAAVWLAALLLLTAIQDTRD